MIEPLAHYMVDARTRELPSDVQAKAKHHILDTLAAMVSGTNLEPGTLAMGYARNFGGHFGVSVIGSSLKTDPVTAALVNGMLAHADETDDSHGPSGTHPGCVVLPAALAVAEQRGASGTALLRAFVLGYDVGCRVMRALGVDRPRRFSEKGVAGPFSAAAAASALLDVTEIQLRHMLAYAGQQCSSIRSYMSDESHVEKAFAFGGMPARNGVTAAMLVDAGLTGEWDIFEGPYYNFLECYSSNPIPEELVKDLGTRFEVMETHIKKWCVGSPIQAPADAVLGIIQKHNVRPGDVEHVTVRMQPGGIATVNDRHMPDVNLQYIVAVMLVDGTLTFAAAHDYERMNAADVLEVKRRIAVQSDDTLAPGRRAVVEVTTKGGAVLRHDAHSVRGSPENPMTTGEVELKAMDLMSPHIGHDTAGKVVRAVRDLERLGDVRDLTALLCS